MEARPLSQRFTQRQRVIRALLLLWLLWEFRAEFATLLLGLWQGFVNLQPFTTQFWGTLVDFFLWVGLWLVIYAIFIFWFAQFALPVSSTQERLQAFWRLLLFGVSFGRWHGPAVFVRNGEYAAASDELEKSKPGVAFVDLRSAIVLDRPIDEDTEDPDEPHKKPPRRVQFLPFDWSAVPAKIRVAGPGLCFIKGGERIVDAVDLRKQSRSRGEVRADTLDGIRVKTSVNAAFTLGQPPEILDVCLGEKGERVLVISWEGSPPPGFRKIKTLSAELRPEDEREIINFARSHPDASTIKSDAPQGDFPFTFDPKRIEQAVYTLTHLNDPAPSPSLSKKWFDWPVDVVAEKFRILLAQHPYLELYDFDNSHAYTIKKLKSDISKQARNVGVLAYRVVTLHSRNPLQEGQTYSEKSLLFYPPRQLTNSQVLRDRGIKVLSAGCGDLSLETEGVSQNLKQTWLSKKEKEVALKEADNSLEIARIRNRARVRAQQSMLFHLSKILENRDYPQEALAILVFQELETAAANPSTRKLLPEHTLDMLANIREMLASDKPKPQEAKNYPQESDEKHSRDNWAGHAEN